MKGSLVKYTLSLSQSHLPLWPFLQLEQSGKLAGLSSEGFWQRELFCLQHLPTKSWWKFPLPHLLLWQSLDLKLWSRSHETSEILLQVNNQHVLQMEYIRITYLRDICLAKVHERHLETNMNYSCCWPRKEFTYHWCEEVVGDPGEIYERVLVRVGYQDSPEERRTSAQDHLRWNPF